MMEPTLIAQDDTDACDLPALRLGDHGAFERLVRRHAANLLVVTRRLLGDEHEAQDAVQDAFASAFRALPKFEAESRLSTWLHRIAVNAALMRLRTRRRRSEVAIESLLPTFDRTGHRIVTRAAWSESAETLLERAETRDLVRKSITRLPDHFRAVLLLRDIDQIDTAATAALLGITPVAVKVRLHRARQALRQLLEQELPR